jgi:hypothetical protein
MTEQEAHDARIEALKARYKEFCRQTRWTDWSNNLIIAFWVFLTVLLIVLSFNLAPVGENSCQPVFPAGTVITIPPAR